LNNAVQRLHGVMQCRRSGCGRTWDRDKNAAINILYVGLNKGYAGNLHPQFVR
jgi:transposase